MGAGESQPTSSGGSATNSNATGPVVTGRKVEIKRGSESVFAIDGSIPKRVNDIAVRLGEYELLRLNLVFIALLPRKSTVAGRTTDFSSPYPSQLNVYKPNQNAGPSNRTAGTNTVSQ
eukprot:616357-Amorphochlora_amoeboformis.AAC.1